MILVNGKFTKNVNGKKIDVLDCMWIQKLHTLGSLSGSLLPDEMTGELRTYCRHRGKMLGLCAQTSSKMQKYLKLLNFRLDVVVKDVCGLTGLKIIADICKGNLKEGHLSGFFKRIAFRKGRQIAITATARKLAMIIWNMVTKKEAYNPPEEHLFLDQKRKLGLVKRMRKQMTRLGITSDELSLDT